MVKVHEGCTARQRSDQMACEHGIAWDMDDPSLPECVKREVCPYAYGNVPKPAAWPSPPSVPPVVIGPEMFETGQYKLTEVCEPKMLPPNFNFTCTGILCGMYRKEDRIIVVEHLTGNEPVQNRLYTEYTPSGKRLRQVKALPNRMEYRYPAGLDWSQWYIWKADMK